MPLSAIVVGAGVGGLTAAIALRRAGHDVLVLERNGEERSQKYAGFAMTVPPNALVALQALGVDLGPARANELQGMDTVQCEPGADRDDRTEFRVNSTEWNQSQMTCAPQLGVHHADYLAALRKSALDEAGEGRPVEIRTGVRVTAYDAAEGTVTVEPAGETMTADLVVAADGIRSTAHRWVLDGGEERPAAPTQINNFRFCIPTETILGDPELAPILAHGAERIGLYVKKGDAQRSVLRYACRDNTLQNFGVYFFPGKEAAAENEEKSLPPRDIATERLQGLGTSMVNLLAHIPDEHMYIWRILDRDPLPKLTSGRLVVVGDACHPMTSTIGQGAAQAVEDAGVLRVAFDGPDVNPEDVPARLAWWEEVRAPRAAAAQILSRSAALGGVLSFGEKELEWLKRSFPDGNIPTKTETLLAYFWYADVVKDAWNKWNTK